MRFGAIVMLLVACPAWAQTDQTIGTPDTVFTSVVSHVPVNYTTSYDRDVSSGTWNQALSYNFSGPRVSLSTNGSYGIAKQLTEGGQRSGSGSFLGHVDFRAAKGWIFSADGRFNKSSIHDPSSESMQRQSRLKMSGQYSATPSRALSVSALLFSEFQKDNSLALRPEGRGLARALPIRNAAGDSVGSDTLLVLRDSTLTTGRQDGLTGVADWKPTPWFRMVTTASGNQVRPTTVSHLGGTRPRSTTFEQRVDSPGSEPNDNYQYGTKLTYQGPHRLLGTVDLKRSRADLAYYDRTALRQEFFVSDQRSGVLHLEQSPLRSFLLNVDGKVSRSLGEYRFRSNQNNLVLTRTGSVGLSFNPSPFSRGALEFDVTVNDNSRQQFGNGTNVSRLLQATGAHRLSRRWSVDGIATATLTSFQYVDSTRDQDNGRAYASIGTGYQISERCSTQVHFSVNRGHTVWIDPSQSTQNNVQTSYQMDALMQLRVTPRLTINQAYSLSAIYQIFDFASAESRNVLSRVKRIDTFATDSLFRFATFQLTHNFLFVDFGSFTRTAPGEDRAYRVTRQIYTQIISGSLAVKPIPGVSLSAIQSLSNNRIETAAATTVNNHWTLTLGATVDRTIFGDTNINGAVQHISSYDELNADTRVPNQDDYWIVGVTLVKLF